MNGEQKRGRGRPRREGADSEVLAVALEILREKGYRELTFDSVTERTGVAKTTIYRRWPSKAKLVAAAVDTLPRSADESVEAILRETAQVLRFFGDADGDAFDAIRAVLAPRRERIREALGQEDGFAADTLVGFLLSRQFVAGLELDDASLAAALKVAGIAARQ